MGIRQDLEKIADEFEALKAENKDLKSEVANLRFELDQKQKDFENVLMDTKRSFKMQYKKHVKKYEMKIQELSKRLKKVNEDKENMSPGPGFQVPGPPMAGSLKINRAAAALRPPTVKHISSSPIKQEIPSTQYSSDSEISQAYKLPVRNPQDDSQAVSLVGSDNSPDLSEIFPSNEFDALKKLTPLQRQTWLNQYYTNKFMNEPNYKINLNQNPITQSNWIALDFKVIDRGEEETPPYMWIKDNTSQEDLIKQQTFDKNNKELVHKCFHQCLNGTNKFHYEILNKFVKANRYVFDRLNG